MWRRSWRRRRKGKVRLADLGLSAHEGRRPRAFVPHGINGLLFVALEVLAAWYAELPEHIAEQRITDWIVVLVGPARHSPAIFDRAMLAPCLVSEDGSHFLEAPPHLS